LLRLGNDAVVVVEATVLEFPVPLALGVLLVPEAVVETPLDVEVALPNVDGGIRDALPCTWATQKLATTRKRDETSMVDEFLSSPSLLEIELKGSCSSNISLQLVKASFKHGQHAVKSG
jgi:hypothetical protein